MTGKMRKVTSPFFMAIHQPLMRDFLDEKMEGIHGIRPGHRATSSTCRLSPEVLRIAGNVGEMNGVNVVAWLGAHR